MGTRAVLAGAAMLAVLPSLTFAEEVQSYFYDVHGRLVAAIKAPAVGGSITRYGLDNANNREGRQVELAPTRPVFSELRSGEFILANQLLRSADGRFMLHLQLDGHLVLYGPTGYLWSVPSTWGQGSTTLTMQADGNLTVRGPSGNLIWQSGTGGNPGARLVLQTDGNLVIYTDWTALWVSGTGGH